MKPCPQAPFVTTCLPPRGITLSTPSLTIVTRLP